MLCLQIKLLRRNTEYCLYPWLGIFSKLFTNPLCIWCKILTVPLFSCPRFQAISNLCHIESQTLPIYGHRVSRPTLKSASLTLERWAGQHSLMICSFNMVSTTSPDCYLPKNMTDNPQYFPAGLLHWSCFEQPTIIQYPSP